MPPRSSKVTVQQPPAFTFKTRGQLHQLRTHGLPSDVGRDNTAEGVPCFSR